MPWFPDFVGAVELARRENRAAGQVDPVAKYLVALDRGDPRGLEIEWPGEVVVYDPRAGEVRGHRHLRDFVKRNATWMGKHHVRTEVVASTRMDGRAVVELLAHWSQDGVQLAWPVAVVAESQDDLSVVFRTYCSQFPVDERRHLRAPILGPGTAHPGGVVGRYQAALEAGDVDAIVELFAPDGYLREPIGAPYTHRGAAELRSFFTMCFSAGGGVRQECCAITDDGVRCALEYNCIRWGGRELPPQAGLTVYERSPDGLVAAARVYDDIETPVVRPGLPGHGMTGLSAR
jgi:ketosteroid isomerase-like protein